MSAASVKATPGPTWPSSAGVGVIWTCAPKNRDDAAQTKAAALAVQQLISVFAPAHDNIKVVTLRVSKVLEVPVLALIGAGRIPAEGEDEREEARLFYLGVTRATLRVVIGVSVSGKLASRTQLAE